MRNEFFFHDHLHHKQWRFNTTSWQSSGKRHQTCCICHMQDGFRPEKLKQAVWFCCTDILVPSLSRLYDKEDSCVADTDDCVP